MNYLFTLAAILASATSDTITNDPKTKDAQTKECEVCHEPPTRHRLMNMFDRFLATPGWWKPQSVQSTTKKQQPAMSLHWPRWASVWDADLDFESDTSLAADVTENKDQFEVTVDLPGYKQNQINVTVDEGVLTIHAGKYETVEEKDKNFVRRERRVGSVSRSFRLPDTVNEDKIASTFESGSLTVTLPKKPEAKLPPKEPKKIEVKVTKENK